MSRRQSRSYDRMIELQRQVPATGFKSAGKGTWTTFDTVPAKIEDIRPSRPDKLVEGLTVSRRPAKVLIDWRDDVDGACRLKDGDRVMEIVGQPAEIGRRRQLEMLAQNWSAAGKVA